MVSRLAFGTKQPKWPTTRRRRPPAQTLDAQNADKCTQSDPPGPKTAKLTKQIKCFHRGSLPLLLQPRPHETHAAPRLINKSAAWRFSRCKYSQDAACGVTTEGDARFPSGSGSRGPSREHARVASSRSVRFVDCARFVLPAGE